MANSSDKNRFNIVDLTTVEPTTYNKSYLVDKRLLDKLLFKIVPATLDEIKADLSLEIGCAKSKEQLFTNLDEYIYLNKIANLVSSIEAEEPKEVAKPVESKQANWIDKAIENKEHYI